MSVTWRPPRKLLPILAIILCLVSALSLVAQQEEIPAAATEQSEPTAVSETPVADSAEPPAAAIAPEEPDSEPAFAPAVADEEPVAASEPTMEQADESASEKVAETADVVAPVETVVAEPVTPAAEPAGDGQEAPATADQAQASADEAPAAAPAADLSKSEEKPAAAASATVPAAAEGKKKEEKTGLARFVDVDRLNVLVIIVCLLGFVSYFTFHAQRGKELFIRRISGLSALEDAVGRATEMGRGVLYIPGIMDMDDIQTIAGVTILGHVAKKTAEYDTPLYAPMTRSFVMSVAQEIVKQAYLEKGRPDAFRPDRINYLTDDQFGYVAGVGGIMMRDKPAACFYLGTFYAESLILAETGNSIGAIQIAGTAEPSQIPFFVAACDYTLIGEELFAASAYLSKNPKEVGSLKGQDISKIIIIAFIIVGTVLISIAQTEFGAEHGIASIADSYMKLFK